MLDKILVPLDGSELAEGILTRIRPLLHRKDGEIVLLRVLSDDERDLSTPVLVARDYLDTLCRKLRAEGAEAWSRVVFGDPAVRIGEVARELGVALTAMSTHGRTGVARWVRGSVAESVLRRSVSPVLLANPFALAEPSRSGLRRILVPLDGSPAAGEILPLCAELAEAFGAEIVLLHALEHVDLEYPTAYVMQEARSDAESMLAAFAARIGRKVPIQRRTTTDLAARSIIDIVARERIDLVAMTTHGRWGLSRWLFGSVAEEVLRHCQCPILVQRLAHDEAIPTPEVAAPEKANEDTL